MVGGLEKTPPPHQRWEGLNCAAADVQGLPAGCGDPHDPQHPKHASTMALEERHG